MNLPQNHFQLLDVAVGWAPPTNSALLMPHKVGNAHPTEKTSFIGWALPTFMAWIMCNGWTIPGYCLEPGS